MAGWKPEGSMRFPLPRRRFYRFLIYGVSIVLVLLASDLVLVQVRRTIHPGLETTRITSPTTADGSVDYLTAIEAEFSRGVTDDNNAAPLLLEAFGRKALPTNQPADGITNRLHMAHLPEAGDYAKLAPWVQANEKPLAKIREATQRSRYFVPMNGGTPPKLLYEILLPHLNFMREASYLLAADALLRAEAGDLHAAGVDLQAMHRLVRLTAQGPTLVERMVSIAIEEFACKTEANIARHVKLDAQSAGALFANSMSLSELPSLARNVDAGERYLALDLEQLGARLGPYETGRIYTSISGMNPVGANPQAAQLFRFVPIQHEEAMRKENGAYDALIVAFAKPSYAERKEAIDSVQQWYDARSNGFSGLLTPYYLLRLVMPGLSRGQDQLETATAQLRLTQITCALAVYRAEHGGYPDSLDLLKSQFPAGIPEDNFSDGPFHYKKRGEDYQLYSVGPNMIDDHGSTTKPADDIDVSVN
jgi:hypothetical protein